MPAPPSPGIVARAPGSLSLSNQVFIGDSSARHPVGRRPAGVSSPCSGRPSGPRRYGEWNVEPAVSKRTGHGAARSMVLRPDREPLHGRAARSGALPPLPAWAVCGAGSGGPQMVNEALLALVWGVDALAVSAVVWLLAADPGHRRTGPSRDGPTDPAAPDASDSDPTPRQSAAQAHSSQVRTSGSTRGPISASTRA